MLDKENFPTRKDKVLRVCVECYEENYGLVSEMDQRRRAAIKRSDVRRTDRCKALIKALLQKSSCMDCGTTDWEVLEFDHRDPKTKRDDIGKLMTRGSITILRAEIAKCDIVCSNCHRKRTMRMFKSWRVEDSKTDC